MLKPINKKIKLIIITFILSFFWQIYLVDHGFSQWSSLSYFKEMCLHAFKEHKWVFCNFLCFCLDSQINMFCHHNEITLWINDSICMAFVGSNFNILEHYTILCVFNIQTVCSLASAVVETNVLSVYQSQFTPSISLKFRRNLSNSIK